VLEVNTRTFATHWTGTGTIENTGNSERIVLEAGESMTSEIVETNTGEWEALQGEYQEADTVLLEYRTGNSEANCESASFATYTTPFESLGFVQLRITSTL
jgi:hypothetical protein